MEAAMAMDEPHLSTLEAKLDGLRELVTTKFEYIESLMTERDQRYSERDVAAKEAVRAALAASEKASDKTERALQEYKIGANEWRDTVKDLIAGLRESRQEHAGESIGAKALWGYIVGAAGFAAIIVTLLRFWK
jgi:hypothetical protein